MRRSTTAITIGAIIDIHSTRDWIVGLRALAKTSTLPPETRSAVAKRLKKAARTEDPSDIAAVIDAFKPAVPAYCAISTHPDLPNRLGIWIDWDTINRDIANGTLAYVDHIDQAPPTASFALILGDEDNTPAAALYRRDGKTWAVVWTI